MTQMICTASVEMVDNGTYRLTVVDYLNDVTHEGTLPDQYVSMLPGLLQQMQMLSDPPPVIRE